MLHEYGGIGIGVEIDTLRRNDHIALPSVGEVDRQSVILYKLLLQYEYVDQWASDAHGS